MIGIGVDLVEVDRFRAALLRTPRLAERLFTAEERSYAQRRLDPTERFAVRFAAKEAVMKALGVGLGAFSFRDVEVVNDDLGAPTLKLTGEADRLAKSLGVSEWRITLTHTRHMAEAIAVAI